MNRLLAQFYDRILFMLALGLAGLSAWWLWQGQVDIRRLKREPTMPVLSGSAYASTQPRFPQASGVTWSPASAQSRGGDWLYEVFTPPAVSYSTLTHSFTVTPPHPASAMVVAESALELLTVEREPYRLQLLGYCGEPGSYQGAFADSLSSETVLARPGHHFSALGLTLRNLDVRKVAVDGGELGPVYDVAAVAMVQEGDTGLEVLLDSRARRLTDTLRAVFRAPAGAGHAQTLHEGDMLAVDGATYRIERIQLDPPEVKVRRSPGLASSEMRVLRPAGQTASQAAPPKAPVSPAVTAVAHRDPEFPSP